MTVLTSYLFGNVVSQRSKYEITYKAESCITRRSTDKFAYNKVFSRIIDVL